MPVAFQVISLKDPIGRCNTILYRSPVTSFPSRVVILFPGDVSDFAFSRRSDPLIAGDPDLLKYEYCLDALVWTLASHVSDSDAVLIIKPTMMIGHFSIFSNFLVCDPTGTPRWADMESSRGTVSSSQALTWVLQDLGMASSVRGEEIKICLLGFSKGCVVLSAILRDHDTELLKRIESIGFIDPGTHTPGSSFPFTDLEYAAFPMSIPITVWSSPYQFKDPRRAWLRGEISEFVSKASATLSLVAVGEEASLSVHFHSIDLALREHFRRI